jgi:hypothetical protein
MATFAVAAAFVCLFLLHAAIAAVCVSQPQRVMQFFVQRAPQEAWAAGLMASAARTRPYRWLLSGAGWHEFVEGAGARPDRFPRIVKAIQLLGISALALNASIVLFVLAMIITK